MKIECGVDQQGNFLSIRYSGILTINEMKNCWLEVMSQNIIRANMKGFVIDIRSSIINIDLEEISILSDLFKKNLNIFSQKRFAYVTESPNQIILPLILQEDDYFYESKPFSTTEAAMDWVLN